MAGARVLGTVVAAGVLSMSGMALAGRIVAVADVFDASPPNDPIVRNQSIPQEKVFGMIREGRGTHFDPDAVDAFLAIADEIVGIMKQCQDAEVSPQEHQSATEAIAARKTETTARRQGMA